MLTNDELRVAAETAEGYPRGHGYHTGRTADGVWLGGHNITAWEGGRFTIPPGFG